MTRTKDVGLSCSLYMIPLFIQERSATALHQHHYHHYNKTYNTRGPANTTVDGERLEPIHTQTRKHSTAGALDPGPEMIWRIHQESLERIGHDMDWESGQDDLFVAIYGLSSRS